MSLTVFDNHTVELTKYPRIYTDKEVADKIMITFFMHEPFLKQVAVSYENAIKYHNECKEYFYTFKYQGNVKTYSAKEIIKLASLTISGKEGLLLISIIPKIDLIYYYLIKNSPFYISLYEAVSKAKTLYFQARDFIYTLNPPYDYYGGKKGGTYTGLEIMEVYAYTQYLVSNRIIKELPEPLH